jgi:hypothetical protein
MTVMQNVEIQPRLLSPSAERMRRLRERRRQGRICFMFQLEPWAVEGLVELRWLHPALRNDRVAALDAFRRFVDYALDMTRNTGR